MLDFPRESAGGSGEQATASLIDNDQFFCTQTEFVAAAAAAAVAAAPITLLFLASFLPSFFRSDDQKARWPPSPPPPQPLPMCKRGRSERASERAPLSNITHPPRGHTDNESGSAKQVVVRSSRELHDGDVNIERCPLSSTSYAGKNSKVCDEISRLRVL